jgi:hypothetical protein
LSRDDNNKKMAKNQEKRYLNTVQNRKFLEEESNNKKMKMIKRMNSIDNRIKEKKIMNDKNKVKKREEGNVRILERNITIQRMLRVQDYKNKLKMDELEEKERKLNEFKMQREKLAWQRAQASTEVQKQKEEALLKFDKLARQKKEIEPEMIRELFPGDNELYENVKEMKRIQKETEENIIRKMDNYDKRNKSMSTTYYNKKSNNDNNDTVKEQNDKKEENIDNEKLEQEIQKKVEEYKTIEYKEFNKLIMEEKMKEEERTKLYENEKDENKRLEIEKKNKEERELASQNINKEKSDIDKRIKEYEENLRKGK